MLRKLLLLMSLMLLSMTYVYADDNIDLPLPPAATANEFRLADIVAQRNITQTALNTVTNKRGMHLGGLHVHKYASGSRALYVYDSGNSRILGFIDPDWTSSLEVPDRVFGQNDSYEMSACNGDNNDITVPPSARTLCLNRGAHAISQGEEPRFSAMDTDTNGNLFVVDQYNNRVLMFLDPFGADANEGDTTADGVWGQADFNSKICNRGQGILPFPSYTLTADGLCTTNTRPASIDPMFAAGLDIDVWGNLWVTDVINNRVLRFPHESATGRPGLTADIVLGQPNMTSIVNNHGACVSQPDGVGFCQLFYLQVNSATGEIFISHNHPTPRISVYAPNTTAQNPTSYTYARKIGLGQLKFPGYVHILDANRILVEDEISAYQDALQIYHTNGTFIRTISTDNVVGDPADGNLDWNDLMGKFTIVDNYLFLVEQRVHNSVLVFDVTQLDSINQLTYAGELLGGVNYIWNTVTGLGLGSTYGLTISQKHNQLFVSDGNRILVWNEGTPFAGRNADFVIGQPGFDTNVPNSPGAFVFRAHAKGMAVDDVNNKLWVARDHEIYAFNLPITANTPVPVITFLARIANSPFLGNLPVKGQADKFIFRANSVSFNPVDQTLWIIDTFNSRAARVANPYTTPEVDLLIGQNTLAGVSCNRGTFSSPTARTLCFPGLAAFDLYGNLYIAEGVYEGRADMPGNKRIVEYDKAAIDAAGQAGLLSEPAANRIYAVPSFTSTPIVGSGFNCLANTPCNPIGIAFDSQNRMGVLSDAYFNDQNKRIYLYSNPLKNTGYVAFDPATDKLLPYPMGQGGALGFSEAHEMYFQDHTWNRIQVVHNNRAPAQPGYVQPFDEAVDQLVDTSVKWNTVSDPDGDSVTYTVYLGQDAGNLQTVASDQPGTSYQPTLVKDTTYYWQIGATDGLLETKGPVWSFTTEAAPVILPDVVLSKTSAAVTEGGNTDSYTLQLSTMPAADVSINLTFFVEGQISADPTTLTFTLSTWDTPQTVTLSAVDDAAVEGMQTLSVQHSAVSEDTAYNGIAVAAVSVTVTDNDTDPIVNELLTNNGFESDGITPYNQPDSWNILNKSQDRLRCNTVVVVAYEGSCAYQFKGRVGEKAILSQGTKNVSALTAGSPLRVSLYYRTNAVQPFVKVKLIVYYDDTTIARHKGVIKTLSTEYIAFALAPYIVESGKTVTKIKLQFQNRAASGKIFIDSASVSTLLPLLPLP